MSWLIFAMLACLSWGIGQTLIKKGLSNISPFVSDIFFVASSFLINIFYVLILGFDKVNWNFFPAILIFGFLASSFNLILPFIIEKTDVSLSGTVLATYPVATILLSIIFLGEGLKFFQIIGVMAIIFGTIMVSRQGTQKFKIKPWVIWALIGAVLLGFADFTGKAAMTKYNLPTFLIAFCIGYLPAILIVKILDKTKQTIPQAKKETFISILGNFLMPLGLVFMYLAFDRGPASLVSPVASTYPVLTIILAFIFLKEKVSKNQLFGILLTSLGIILTSI